MQFRRLAHSLVAQVLGLALLITIFGTAVRFTLLSNTMRDGIEELVTAHLSSEASYVASDIDEKIRARKQLLETMAKQLPASLLDHPRELEGWLAERHALAPYFSLGMTIVPASGKGVIGEFPLLPGRRQLDFSDADWFRAARDNAVFAIGKPTVGRVVNQGIIVMAAPILDARGRVLAVLNGVSTLDTPGFLNLIQNNTIGNTGGFLLISPRDKLFVAASMPNMRLRPTPPTGANRLHDRAMEGWRGAGITVNAFGVEEIAAIGSVPSAGWFVVARMPTAEAFQSVTASGKLLVQKGGAITLIVLTIFGVFLFYLFRPLRQASRQIHQMADGDLPLEPLAVVRHDEVGEMVDGFNFLVAKVRENEQRMTRLAHQDALTSLPNRLSFLMRAEQTVALFQRRNSRLALMFIDLDGFKPINDVYGHEAGDQLLQQVAARLGESVRKADLVARYGGDEFVVLLTDIGDPEATAVLADKIIAKLSQPYLVNEMEVVIGASIGVAFLPDDAEDMDSLIAQADAAMYDAKRAGRNCYRFAHKPG
ncbi:diguanylate cyclase domain-containing protein [Dechloromonas sp. A34]|uniref:sensor domain-containing diguanylate cyclase n=1 Tax=Dechloromonas sp. A34 TaxID=447588 RepID=UPI0022497FE3|nr:diguanylate cyclase [Dechloromonas sp. A34]